MYCVNPSNKAFHATRMLPLKKGDDEVNFEHLEKFEMPSFSGGTREKAERSFEDRGSSHEMNVRARRANRRAPVRIVSLCILP